MSNLNNEAKNYGREVRQQSTYKDDQGHTHVNTTHTTETVNNASNSDSYRDGYATGRVSERLQQEEGLAERDNNNAARGLLLGMLVTALAALTGGAIWLLNQRDQTPAPVAPVVLPAPSNAKPSPQASKAPEKTTVIEKTKEVLVPVPQPVSSSPAPRQEVNITVPSPATQPESKTSSTPAQNTQSNATSTPTTSVSPQANPSPSTPATEMTPQPDSASSNNSASGDSSDAAQ